jgi:hypothetical protein
MHYVGHYTITSFYVFTNITYVYKWPKISYWTTHREDEFTTFLRNVHIYQSTGRKSQKTYEFSTSSVSYLYKMII